MSTKSQKPKKETRHVRVPAAWHKFLKIKAAERGVTVVRILTEILEDYYGKKAITRPSAPTPPTTLAL